MSEPYWEPFAAVPAVAVATTLPASPTDGLEAILVDSLTAPTYAWRFKYLSGITGADKWLFIGGAPLVASGNSSKTSGSFSALASITVPRAGIYAYDGSVRTRVLGGTPTDPATRLVVAGSVVASNNDGSGRTEQHGKYAGRTASIAAAATIQLDYAGNATDLAYGMAELLVIPVRVA